MAARPHRLAFVGLTVVGAAGGCGDDSLTATTGSTEPTGLSAVIDVPGAGNYSRSIDPSDFVGTVDNPYLPFTTGARWVYEGVADGEQERTVVVVTDEQRTVMGVAVTVVRDTVSVDGQVVEDTYDWFAQDSAGNVWYFGEDVKNFDAGRLTDTDGSWEAGVDGAFPGIVMLANPGVGQAYRQEYWPGEAEDLGEVIGVDGCQDVPTGSYDEVVTTRDWNPLEPDVIEEKQYAPGVGLIRETHVVGRDDEAVLVDFTPGT